MCANVSISVTPGSETLWSVHSGQRCWTRRSSRFGAGSGTSAHRPGCERVPPGTVRPRTAAPGAVDADDARPGPVGPGAVERGTVESGSVVRGNHVEREDEVAWAVGAADRVADVDVEGAGVHGVEADRDVGDLDARLPALQRQAHLVGDRARRGLVGRREHQVVDAAAELGTHRPLTGGGAQHEPDRLGDLLLAGHQRDAAGGVGAQREAPARADELLAHRYPPMITFRAPPLIVAPQAVSSPLRAAGRPSMSTWP